MQAQRPLEHSRLRVHPVEDRDLAARVALLDEAGDLGGDVARLGLLVLDLDHPHRIAVAELRPEPLFLPLGVVRDHGVRRLENRVRRAVVLLERDRACLGEVALELQDVADVGATEGVDRLVGIADRADVVMVLGEELQQAVLRVIRVLVLVDEDVPEGVLPVLSSIREVLQDLHGQHQHVVEVDGVRGGELALVQLVRLGNRLVVEGRDPLGVHRRCHELVLRVRDLGVHTAGDEALRILLELLQALLDEAHLVGGVVDREVRPVSESLGLAAQDSAAGGVEGEDPDRTRDGAEHRHQPLAHLPRRLVREGDRQDLVRLDADGRDQVGDTVREHARLPGAGSGDHEQRALGVQDGLPLGGIQVREIPLGRRHGHPVDASGR